MLQTTFNATIIVNSQDKKQNRYKELHVNSLENHVATQSHKCVNHTLAWMQYS
jgi:hypothetical protein